MSFLAEECKDFTEETWKYLTCLLKLQSYSKDDEDVSAQ